MYKKLRTKIVAAMSLSLLALFIGTLLVIFLTSYHGTLAADRDMMTLYASAYWENGNPAGSMESPPEMFPQRLPAGNPSSQFYSVELDEADSMVAINNEPRRSNLDDVAMVALALELKTRSRSDGIYGAWVYHWEARDGRTLVVLLDNTLVSDSTSALLKNALRFGAVMVLALLLLSFWLAQWMVHPLEDNDRQQRRFIADASHELKTPVAVIDTNAVLLRRDIGESRWLDNIEAENRRMGTLVGQMLALSRLEKPNAVHDRQDLSRIVEGAILTFEGVAFEKGHALETEIVPGMTVEGDGEQLKSMLSILLDNAAEYALEGEPIRITLKKVHGSVALRVTNPCLPLSDSKKEHLFDRFYRADESRTGGTEQSHYGLGLSIAKGIVEAHRGSIRADCDEGAFTVEVFLPLA